jgi:hypothetical protein
MRFLLIAGLLIVGACGAFGAYLLVARPDSLHWCIGDLCLSAAKR